MEAPVYQFSVDPTPKQYEAWLALQNQDIAEIYFGGAAGGGKSWLGCESRIARAIAIPGYRTFIARNELTRLMNSTYVTLLKVLEHHKIPKSDWKFNGQYHYMEFINGSRINLLDVAYQPSDPMFERFGSYEFTDGWFEEAGEISFMAIDILRSRVGRHLNNDFKLNPDLLFTFNPNKGWVYRVYKLWKEGQLPADTVFIQSLFSDNPYTKDIYGKQLDRIKDKAMRSRLKFGNFEYDDDPTQLMERDAIIDLFTNTLHEDDAARAMTIDVARLGVDKTVMYLWEGWTLTGVRVYAKQDTAVTTEKAKTIAEKKEIAYSRIVPDEDGVGGGVVDNMRGVRGFVANSTALDNPQTKEKENYANLKSQCSYVLADKVNTHKMAVKVKPENFRSQVPGMTYEVWKDQFIEELESVKSKNPDRDAPRRIRAKDEVKEEIGRSPDFADTAVMRALLEYPNTRRIGSGVKIIKPKGYRGLNRDYKPRQPGDNF